MACKLLSLVHAPDADRARQRSQIDTGMLQLFTIIVKDQSEAVEVCHEFIEEEGIDSVLLRPGFRHEHVAGIVKVN